MDYPQASNKLSGGSLSRIDHDVNRVKEMTIRVRNVTERIIHHAHTLGYFAPPPSQPGTAPTPVITSLSDAIQDHDRGLDELSGSLNLFD